MTGIITLNWNGWEDTIECLDSLYSMPTEDFFIIVVDNGSTDESAKHICQHLNSKGLKFRDVKSGHATLAAAPTQRECILLQTGENLGFARGNNEALRFLAPYMPKHILLLNNDTIVEPDFLDKLVDFSTSNAQYSALTPLICYNHDRNLVWNCGGWQHLGLRKYYYAKQPVGNIREKGHIDISFVTGCSLFFKRELLQSDSSIFCEDFFFGEEDFNFCMRMKREHHRMACVLGSKIYHKVNASTKKKTILGMIYINYLNHFIDIRRYGKLRCFTLWAHAYALYIIFLLYRNGYKMSETCRLVRRVLSESKVKDLVTHQDFLNALKWK